MAEQHALYVYIHIASSAQLVESAELDVVYC